MTVSSLTARCLLALLPVGLFAAQRPRMYRLPASPATVAWGYYWAQAKPVLRVRSGDIVVVDTLLTNSPRGLERAGLAPDRVEPALRAVYAQVKDRGPGGHILTGPIYVEGAEPGDTLAIQILKIAPRIDYAYNAFAPHEGFLPQDFPYRRIRIIPLDWRRGVARFAPGIAIPLHPFFGSMGVAPPPSMGRYSSVPPNLMGGNMDDKDLVAGSTLYLPVFAPGALFEIGDGHAGQGDGEVDITALETSLRGTVRLTVIKHTGQQWPRAETPSAYISLGFDSDLKKATTMATEQMISFLAARRHLSRDDAYMLCSVAGNLHITELVDQNVGVEMLLPKRIFVAAARAGRTPGGR